MEIVDVNTANNVHECGTLSETQVQKLLLTWIQSSIAIGANYNVHVRLAQIMMKSVSIYSKI